MSTQAKAASRIFRRLDAIRGPRHRPTAVEYWDGRIEISPDCPGLWDLLDVRTALEITGTATVTSDRHPTPTGSNNVSIGNAEFYMTLHLPLAEDAPFTEQQRQVGERIMGRSPAFGLLEDAVAAHRLDAEGRPR